MDGDGARAGLPGQVDWEAPWLAPYRACGQRVWARWAGGLTLAQALNAGRDEAPATAGPWPAWAGRLRFVPQADLPAGQSYEAFVRARAEVPTRDNLHDFFNGLVWLRFPALKSHLNALHAAQLPPFGRAAAGCVRGPVRDALTLFDENAAVWQAPAVLRDALRRRDWTGLFLTHRAAWRQARLTLVGHALLEKLCRPRKNITAHVWTLAGTPSDGGDGAGWPGPATALARQLQPDALRGRPWSPLPVLGVPGWCAGNDAPSFYVDEAVFRPAVGDASRHRRS